MTRRENSCYNSGNPFARDYLRFITYPCTLLGQGFFIFEREVLKMETRIAIIGIIVENTDSVEKLNSVLHEYREYIVGRMGIPYPKRDIQVISIIIDAPNDAISALSGKLGMLPNVNIKTVYSKQ